MEREKILKALEIIKEVCGENEACSTCPLRDWDDDCLFSGHAPYNWELNTEDKPWRAIYH